MTVRECYRRIATFHSAEYIPNFEGGHSPRTLRLWQQEGMPAGQTLEGYFGLDSLSFSGPSYNPMPGVTGCYSSLDQYRPLLEPLGYELAIDEANCMVARKDGRESHIGHDPWGSIRLHLKHGDPDEDLAEGAFVHVQDALTDVKEWEALRGQFQPDPARYPADWDVRMAELRANDSVRILVGPSMVGDLVMEMGFENYGYKTFDAPEMITEILDARTSLAETILEKAVADLDFDMLWFWEDMAFRNGPFLSPAVYESLALPFYQRLVRWYKSHGGEICALDSDGDVRGLIPVWLKAGINHIWPLEPFAGMDVVALRAEYGHAFSMRGGIDKFVVAQGKDAIDRELDRICPVVQDGGYIPHLDHMLPHASFENYCYYMEEKRKLIGTRNNEIG